MGVQTKTMLTDAVFSNIIYEFQTIKEEHYANRVMLLYKRWQKQHVSLTFAGHFSAGKSSILNKKFGMNVLPTSPIPMSGNVVSLNKGTFQCLLQHESGTFYDATNEATEQEAKKWMKDSRQFRKIEWTYEHLSIPSYWVVNDTPGIDSTDETHEHMTTEELRAANIIIYVMDYNYVKSEKNLKYIKRWVDAGKEVVIFINAIDKHHDEELSFAAYRNSIEQTLKERGLEHCSLYFVSTKYENHPHNEWNEAWQWIERRMEMWKQQYDEFVHKQLQQLLYDYEKEVNIRYIEECEVNYDEVHDLEVQLTNAKKEVEKIEETQRNFLTNLIRNAQLFPFSTRQYYEQFLESCQPKFSVGLFFRQQKRERIQSERRERVIHEIEQSWKQFVIPFLTQYVHEQFQSLSLEERDEIVEYLHIKEKNVQQWIPLQSIELVSSERVVTDCRELHRLLESWCKKQWLTYTEQGMKKIKESKKQLLLQQEQVYKEKKNVYEQQQSMFFEKRKNEERIEVFQMILQSPEQLSTAAITEPRIRLFSELNVKKNKNREMKKSDEKEYKLKAVMKHKLNHDDVHFVLQHEQTMKSLSSYFKQLQRQWNAWKESTIQIAVFGTFSAGKSTFLNALLNKKVLPSSPHPLTSTLCRIVFPHEHAHGVVEVVWKNDAAILTDWEEWLLQENETAENADALYRILQRSVQKGIKGNTARTVYAESYVKGYANYIETSKANTFFTTNDLPFLLTTEHVACFIESVTLYWDCPLTQLGVQWIDTPGGSSMYRRHTEVAFNMLRHVDYSFYLMYYNHSFSVDDQQFLKQFQRLQNGEESRVTFLINAMDLAHDDEEREEVKQYVTTELYKLGITSPKVEAISSRTMLERQSMEQAGFSSVMNEIQYIQKQAEHYKKERLLQTMLQIKVQLQQQLQSRQATEEERIEKSVQLQKLYAHCESTYNRLLRIESVTSSVQKELQEHIFYIKKRLQVSGIEFFKLYFNPTQLRGSYRDNKQHLESALQSWFEHCKFEWENEWRVLSHRMELFIKTRCNDQRSALNSELLKYDSLYSMPFLEVISFKEYSVVSMNPTPFFNNATPLLKMFRNSQLFFEKNEKEKLKETLQHVFQQWLEEETIHWEEHISQFLENEMKVVLKQYAEIDLQSIHTYVESVMNVQHDIDEETIQSLVQYIEEITVS